MAARRRKKPVALTAAVKAKIIERVESSNLSMHSLCAMHDDMPTPRAIYRARDNDPDGFGAEFEQARHVRHERMMDEAFEQLEDAPSAVLGVDEETGEISYSLLRVLDAGGVRAIIDHRSKVFDASVKLAGQMAPRKFGAKVKLEHEVSSGMADELAAAQERLAKSRASKKKTARRKRGASK